MEFPSVGKIPEKYRFNKRKCEDFLLEIQNIARLYIRSSAKAFYTILHRPVLVIKKPSSYVLKEESCVLVF